jgi:hypothetical protein
LKRFLISICLGSLIVAAYFAAVQLAIRHATFDFYDASLGRLIAVDVAVRRDSELRAMAGLKDLPVVIVSHANTVKSSEYSFIVDLFARRGYLVVCIQHDLPTDPPLVTVAGALYVGRLQLYERGVTNILYTIGQLKKIEPHADFGHLTLIGHSTGADISVLFARQNPDLVEAVITLDNLRVPFSLLNKFRTLSFRSKDWKADPGVVPDEADAKKAGIEIIRTDAQHVEMSDRGPDRVKLDIEGSITRFLNENASEPNPRTTVDVPSG